MIFPDNEYLSDYKDSDFGSVISTMQVEAITGTDTFQLGDSGISVSLSGMVPGQAGMEMFKQNAQKLLDALEQAMPLMKDKKFVDFWAWAKEDYEKNGLNMPIVGKVM